MDLGDSGKQFASRKGRPKSGPAGRPSNPPNADPFPLPTPPPKPAVPVRTRHVNSSQHPRLDAVAHYPFADSKGSAASLVSSPSPRPAIFTIGAPQRRRLCDRAYHEARRTAAGLRVADIPEVLRGLGIQLPRDIERAFLLRSLEEAGAGASPGKAGGGQAAGEGGEAGDGEGGADPTALSDYVGLVVEPVVSLAQWRTLVERYVDREQRLLERLQRGEGMRWTREFDDEDEVVAALLADEGSELRAMLGGGGGAGEDEKEWQDHCNDGFFLAQSATYPPYQPTSPPRGAGMLADFGAEEQELLGRREAEARQAFHATLGRTLLEAQRRKAASLSGSLSAAAPGGVQLPGSESRRFARLRKEIYGTLEAAEGPKAVRRSLVVRTTHAHRLRQVQSRIGQEVRMDRRRFQHGREMHTASALATIAKHRVEALARTREGAGWDGIGLGPRERDVGGGGSSSSVASDARGRLADLDSGVAAMTIAESFLSSSVGKQVVKQQRQDRTKASLSLREAAGGMGVAEDDEVDEGVRAEVQFLLGGAEASAAGADAGAGRAVDRAQLRSEQGRGREVFKGWKSTKGGLAVDFGPARGAKG